MLIFCVEMFCGLSMIILMLRILESMLLGLLNMCRKRGKGSVL